MEYDCFSHHILDYSRKHPLRNNASSEGFLGELLVAGAVIGRRRAPAGSFDFGAREQEMTTEPVII